MKRGAWLAGFAALVLAIVQAAERRPFFAFDNGLKDVADLEAKAALLQELGYDGIAWRPGQTAEMLAALDRHGLKMVCTYVSLKPRDGTCGVPEEVAREIDVLKGRDTVVWLMIQGPKKNLGDEAALETIRRVADLAERNGLRVALYPHANCFTSTGLECLRLARLANRPNVGVTFNLCHFLLQADPSTLESEIRELAPLLWMVSLNGAEPSRQSPILPLGEGTFDAARVLRALDGIGYRGPVGLQCYRVKGPARDHLAASMAAWRGLTGVAP